jgi:head-tail adaptor
MQNQEVERDAETHNAKIWNHEKRLWIEIRSEEEKERS